MTTRYLDLRAGVVTRARKVSKSLGFEITRVDRDSLGTDPFADMRYLAVDKHTPVIFDAGANIGQSVHLFKTVFPSSDVHSFEPSPTIFPRLCEAVSSYSGVHPSNCGLGPAVGEKLLLENSVSEMSSFLPPGRLAWGNWLGETIVPVDTVDNYSDRQGISLVEILKTDTQGFDLEVVKGSSNLIESHRLHMVYMEIIFADIYKGVPPCEEVIRYMTSRGFQLFCFYQFHFQDDRASWTDALFVDPAFAGSPNSRTQAMSPDLGAQRGDGLVPGKKRASPTRTNTRGQRP